MISMQCEKCGGSPVGLTITVEAIFLKCVYCGWRRAYVNMNSEYIVSLIRLKDQKLGKAKKDTVSKVKRVCSSCGKTFKGTRKHRYCLECKAVRRKAQIAENNKRFRDRQGIKGTGI